MIIKKISKLIFPLFILIFVSHSSVSFTSTNTDTETRSSEYQSDLNKIDELFLKRENVQNAIDALQIIHKYYNQQNTATTDTNVLWRVSLLNYYVGHHTDKSKSKERKNYFQEGVDSAQKCTEISTKPIVECYFWLATNTALLKQETGIFSLAFNLKDLIKLFIKAAEIDATYADGGPYRLLGQLYWKAPSMLGGDNKKAEEFFNKAIQIAPYEPLNYSFYAKYLLKENKKKAKEIIETGLSKAKDITTPKIETVRAIEDLKAYQKEL